MEDRLHDGVEEAGVAKIVEAGSDVDLLLGFGLLHG